MTMATVYPSLLRLSLLAAATQAISPRADGDCPSNTLEVSYPAPVAADGWTYRLVAEGLTRPRGILFDSEGGLLVVDGGTGLVHFRLEDEGGTCVSVGERTVLVEDEDLNHGIALSHDGNTIFASTANDVYSWPYDATSPGPLDNDSRRTLVTNMTSPGHTTRTLLLSRSRPGILLVSRGSDSNEDLETEHVDSGRSQIRSFNISRLGGQDDGPYDYLDGDVWGWGLRNPVGTAEDPVHGGIWSVENSVDQLRRDSRDIHTDNPGEELNFHGFIDGSVGDGSVLRGTGEENNYGYPLCYALWSTDDFPNLGNLSTGDQFAAGQADNMTDESCNEDYIAPVLTFQAHTAPLDIKFTDDGSEAFISFHGSWNRNEPVGYKISSVAFNQDGMPTAPRDSRNATTDILTAPELGNCPGECARPVGLAWDSEGRLWFSSDSTGEIFVMARGAGGRGGSGGSGGDGGGGEDAGLQLRPGMVMLGAVVVGLLLV